MAVLLGRQAPVGTTADFNAAGHNAAWTFVASASGQLKYIFSQTKVSNPTATGIELGIYSNVAGVPSVRLGFAAVDDLTAARGTGVFRATLATEVAIVGGTTYWLARYMATENCDFQGDAAAGTYSETTSASDMQDPWPATAAGGTTTIIWGESSDSAPVRPVVIPNQFVGPMALRRRIRRVPVLLPTVASTTYTDSGSGTITLSGTGTESHTHSRTAAGTITLSGTGTQTHSHTASGSGTITLTGTGTDSYIYTDARAGTITLSGTGSQSQTHTASGAGTVTLSGTRADSMTHSTSATGTVTLSGSGVETYVPPGGPGVVVNEYDQTPEILLQRHPH